MRFNLHIRNQADARNYENAPAHTLASTLELYAAVATPVFGEQFYEAADIRLARLRELFNLAGYSPTPLDVRTGQGVVLIAGWSDKIFDVLATLENGGSALTEIEKINSQKQRCLAGH